VTAIDVPNRRGDVTPLGRWCRDNRVAYHRLADRVGIGRRFLIEIVTGQERPTMEAAILLRDETGLSFDQLLLGVQIERMPK
jgi:hypothetical protein